MDEHMAEHFDQVSDIHSAVIRGDLEAIKEPAQWMAEHKLEGGVPDGWGPHLAEMRNAASLAVEATDIATASAAVSAMAKSCGDCHQAMNAVPEFVVGSAPQGEEGVVPHMIGHMWAADRMWEGLIIPSDESWANGVEVLAGAPLHSQDVSEEAEHKEALDTLTKQVHELARQGGEMDDIGARAELYGQFLATCAECHQMLGKGGPQ
jgi:cytochrome c553